MTERRRRARPAAPSSADLAGAGRAIGIELSVPARPSAEARRFLEMTTETLERMPLGLVALDHEHRIRYANPAALALVGKSPSEVVGQRSFDVLPELLGTRLYADEAQTSPGQTVGYEVYLPSRERWVDVLACPTRRGVNVFLRDISKSSRADEDVRRTETLLRGSLDTMLDSFVICSTLRDANGAFVDFRVDFANRAAGLFFGRPPDTLIGAPFPDGVPRLRGMPFADALRGVVESGDAWVEDAVAYEVPGRDRAAGGTLSVQIIKFGDGCFAAWRDVTERQRARLERERLAAALEQTIDGVVIADAEGIVTYANPSYLLANGLVLDEVVGRPAALVAAELVGPDGVAGRDRAALASKPWLQEIERVGADGTSRHLAVSMTPVKDANATVTSFVVVARDVTELREAEEELALEARVRVALVESLHNIPAEATLDQAAQAICDELVKLPFVDSAAVEVFMGPSDVQIIGHRAPAGFPVSVGDHPTAQRAALLWERAQVGPWAEFAVPNPADGGWMASLAAAGLQALAYGPIALGDRVVGILVIGTFDKRFARLLVEKRPAIVAISATSSALLAGRIFAMRREADLRGAVASVLASRAFRPVFQPIIDLESGEVVGYEALTRFDSGQPPDRCFADAWSVGLGPSLALATIEAAIAGSRALPPGRWLDLNVSPQMLEDPDALRQALWAADRPVVLEITEHDLIDDYAAVREGMRALGHDVRLAVDDAGAGVANFGHIIELRPDFVKLDISLVRRVNANLGRQAMVVGMRHFSRTAGCRLVAEGIETEEEAHTLAGLGVEFGQGFLFGHPESVEVWAAAAAAGRDERHPMFLDRPRRG